MSSPIANGWIKATVLIETKSGTGTGFLVARRLDDNRAVIFAITNKHVIAKTRAQRLATTELTIHFNSTSATGTVGADKVSLRFGYSDIAREHIDDDVDVVALNVTDLVNSRPLMSYATVTYDDFADSAKLAELDVTIGEDVVTIGYPLGLRHRLTNYPIVRGGIIATRIGDELEDEVPVPGGNVRTRRLRGFLVDGATVPGSSGSPVVLKPVPGRVVRGDIHLGVTPPILLGIVAETRYAPIRLQTGAIPSFAGLGLAFDAATVRETVELFFPGT